MGQEVVIFSKPEELIGYLDEHDLLINLSHKEAELLLDYMEGHGYCIGAQDGSFIRMDVNEPDGEIDEYTIDEVIDIVCEWNYELIQEANERRNSPDDFLDFCQSQKKYEALREDEKVLDKMFERTCYGKEIHELALKLADEVIQNLNSNKGIDTVIASVTEEVKQYSTDKKGKVR